MAAIVFANNWAIRHLRYSGRWVVALAITGCGGSGSGTAPLPAPQNITSPEPYYIGTLHRDAGRTVLTFQYGFDARLAAGPDQKFFTGDDAVQSYTLDSADETGSRQTHSTTMTTGNDNLLFTADDNTGYYEIVEKDNSGRTLRTLYFKSSGPDQVAFTADDEISFYDAIQDDGALSQIFVGPGNDGTWLTSDDVPGNMYTRIEPNSATRFQKRTQYESGPDGVKATADDILCFITETWDLGESVWEKAEVNMDRCVIVNGSGAHGTVTAYDGTGRELHHKNLDNPGDDGIWLTADDVTKLRVTLIYKESETLYNVYAADGSIEYIIDDQFDPKNPRNFRSINYIGPGEDGAWHTLDDTIGRYITQQERVVSSTITERITKEYSQVGADNLWFTADDVLLEVGVNVRGTQ